MKIQAREYYEAVENCNSFTFEYSVGLAEDKAEPHSYNLSTLGMAIVSSRESTFGRFEEFRNWSRVLKN